MTSPYHLLASVFVLCGLYCAVNAWEAGGTSAHHYVSPFDRQAHPHGVNRRVVQQPRADSYHYGYVSKPPHASRVAHSGQYYGHQAAHYDDNKDDYVHPYVKAYKKHYPVLIPVGLNHKHRSHRRRRPHHRPSSSEDYSSDDDYYYDSDSSDDSHDGYGSDSHGDHYGGRHRRPHHHRRRGKHYYYKKKTTTTEDPTTSTTETTTGPDSTTTTTTDTTTTGPDTTTTTEATTTTTDATTTSVTDTTTTTVTNPTTTVTTDGTTTTDDSTTTTLTSTTTDDSTTTTPDKLTYPPHEHPDYYGYSHGYAPKAPKLMYNDFCYGLADGNFANPGLSHDADPRCTYVTCAGQRTIIFNCPYGTFNGYNYLYHNPVYSKSLGSMRHIPHHRYGSQGSDFCGHIDVPTYKGPVCGRPERKHGQYLPGYQHTPKTYPTKTTPEPPVTYHRSQHQNPHGYGSLYPEYTSYHPTHSHGSYALNNDFCKGLEDGHYADPGMMTQYDPRCSYIACSYGRSHMFNCSPGTFNGLDYPHHRPVWNKHLNSYQNVYHHKYQSGGFCNKRDEAGICSRRHK